MLEHDPDLAAERIASVALDVRSVDRDRAAVRLVEPEQEARDRGLPGPGYAHESEPLARPQFEGHPGQGMPAVAVIERHRRECDVPPYPVGLDRIRDVLDLRHGLEDFADAVRAGGHLGEVHRHLREISDRFVDARHIGHDQHQLPGHHAAPHDLHASEQRGGRGPNRGHEEGGARRGRLHARHADALPEGLVGDVVVPFLLMLLPSEGLHQRHGGQHLVEARSDAAVLLALLLERELGLPIQVEQSEAEEGKRAERDEAHPPVQPPHDPQHADHREDLIREFQQILREDVLHRAGVLGERRQQVARSRAVVERQRQSLQMREHLAPERVEHPVAERLGDEDLGVGEDAADR